MNADAAADALRALASRVRRNVPMRIDPERFHEEASEIAHGIAAVAEQLAPSMRQGRVERPNDPGIKAKPSPGFKGRTVLTTHIIAGRRVTVQQRRKPFFIHIG